MRPWPTALLLLVAAACADGGPRSGPLDLFNGHSFHYVAYGANDAPLLDGTIILEYADLREAARPLYGSWEIHWAPGTDSTSPVGPQVGSGNVTGSIGDDGVVLDLTPTMADNNVDLRGLVQGGVVKGSWVYSTLVGPTASGRFTAEQLPPPASALERGRD